MTDSEHDDDFEAYLKRRVPIDQRMKTVDRLEPPPELDRIVIDKARNAIQNSPQAPLYRAPRWALPVGLAATLVIAFSIVLNLGIHSARQQRQSATAAAQAPAAASAPATERESVPAGAPVQAPEMQAAPADGATRITVTGSRRMAPSESNAPGAAGGSSVASKTFARMRPPPIKTAPWPPLRQAAAKPVAPSDARSREPATAESTAEFDSRSRSAERRVAEKRMRTDDSERAAVADVGSSTSPSATVAANASRDAPVVNALATHVAPSAIAPPPPVPPPRPLVDATTNAGAPEPLQLRLAAASPEASDAMGGVKINEPRVAERLDSSSGGRPAARKAAPAAMTPSPAPGPVGAPAPVAAPAAAAPAAAGSGTAASAADRREHPDPKAWLDQIQKMRAAGLTAQAEQELKRFRDTYPGYPTSAPDGGAQ
jgi:hypothetical protein